MDKHPVVLYKTLVVGVIILFIGVGVQPVFAVKTIETYDTELEEITIQFYETDRTYNHTILLTKEQVKELENIFNSVRSSLDNADSPIEIEVIYDNAVVSLDNLGLLPDEMNIEYTQRLVKGKTQNPTIVNTFKRWSNSKGSMDANENFNCYISGSATETYFQSPIGTISWGLMNMIWEFFARFEYFREYFIFPILSFFSFPLIFLMPVLWLANPIPFGYRIGYGAKYSTPDGNEKRPAKGWVHTEGDNGTKDWEGSFYGNLPKPQFAGLLSLCYTGTIGYTGIKYIDDYFGYALWVKIRYK
jgi:hypothetical protein